MFQRSNERDALTAFHILQDDCVAPVLWVGHKHGYFPRVRFLHKTCGMSLLPRRRSLDSGRRRRAHSSRHFSQLCEVQHKVLQIFEAHPPVFGGTRADGRCSRAAARCLLPLAH